VNDALTYDEFVRAAAADPAVVGLVLIGSHAHDGLASEHSDHDLWVVLADGAASDLQRLHGHRTELLDLVVITLSRFKAAGMPGFARYALARSKVVLDRLEGGIAAILAEKRTLGAEEARRTAVECLDGYANLLYRSAKNHRDGLVLAARLDATESLGYLLDTLFAMDLRPRPYNRYLEWELERFPLPGWETRALLDALGAIAATGDLGLQRRLFGRVEEWARAVGLADELDSWGDDLKVMRS
jgi:hypothetical protein